MLLAALVVVAAGAIALPARVAAPQTPRLVTVAYPELPVAWHPALTWSPLRSPQPAAIDLAALWGAPLYEIDAWGQLRPALAERATVHPGAPWTVAVELRPGRWSDGRPVVADDVVATLGAMDDAGVLDAPLVGVRALDSQTVELAFDRPYGRWPYLLAGGWPVLPAHVLAGRGLEAFRDAVPVSAGRFRVERVEPDLRVVLVAHPDGPLGPPAIDRLEVLVVPGFETALGLLRDGRVDATVGHLALNPVDRAARLDGVRAAAPLGGTWMALRWLPPGDAVQGRPTTVRQEARSAIDLSQLVEGLLGEVGAPATSTLPGRDGPWQPAPPAATSLRGARIDVLVPGAGEVAGATARVVQRELRGAGAEVTIVAVGADDVERDVDAALVVNRDLPRPALLGRVPPALGRPAELLAGDAAGAPYQPAVRSAEQLLHHLALDLPLYRVGVTHVWREGLDGLVPSSWPGLAFWSVGEWR